MSAQILDGKRIAQELRSAIRAAVAEAASAGKRPPGLAVVLVGSDSASEVYVRAKRRDCDEVGFHSVVQQLSANVTQEDLEGRIRALNEDRSIDGILVQLPLPAHIDANRIIDCIDPGKDVGRLPSLQHRPAGPAPPHPALLHAQGHHAAAGAHRQGLPGRRSHGDRRLQSHRPAHGSGTAAPAAAP